MGETPEKEGLENAERRPPSEQGLKQVACEEMYLRIPSKKAHGESPSMTTTMFRDLLRQRPFRAFRLVMSSGESYD